MKKILLLLILTTAYSKARCQLDKGIWLLGGSGSFYNYHEAYNSTPTAFTAKYTEMDISASIGYFLADKFAVGLRPTFSSVKGEVIDNLSTNSYKIAVGPFARYYFLQMDRPFNLLSDISYQSGINKRIDAFHEKGKYNTFSVMAGPEIFFNSSAGLEILLGYSQKITSIERSIPENNFKMNKKGFQISVGFQLHLEKN
jgi:hypothetical protein